MPPPKISFEAREKQRLLYWETVGPRRFEISTGGGAAKGGGGIHPQGSADSLTLEGGLSTSVLGNEALLRGERERAERERERERIDRERARVEKDKALLGLSRATVHDLEEGRTNGEIRNEYMTDIRNFGGRSSVGTAFGARPATAPPPKRLAKRRVAKPVEWADRNTDLIKSLLENYTTTRSFEVRRKSQAAIESEVSKLAHDSYILQTERVKWEDQMDMAARELHFLDAENRHLRDEVEVLQGKLVSADVRVKDLIGRLAESERTVAHLRAEEGCRDRLVQALRQLEEESQAKVTAEQQVRSQMERIKSMTEDREGLLREIERERGERSGVQGSMAGLSDKNAELVRALGRKEEEKSELLQRVAQLEQEAVDAKHLVDSSQRTASEARELQHLLARTREDCNRSHSRATQSLVDQERLSEELRGARDQAKVLLHQNEMLKAQLSKDETSSELPRLRAELQESHQQSAEQHRRHQKALDAMAKELSMAAARNEDLRRKLSAMEVSIQRREEGDSDRLASVRHVEEENKRLQEHATLAAHQFHKLGDESARLLSACQTERDLRAQLEEALRTKDGQITSLVDMNARLSRELAQSQGGGVGGGGITGAFSVSRQGAAAPAGSSDLSGYGLRSASPFGVGAGHRSGTAGPGHAIGSSFDSAALNQSSAGAGGDRQRLLDEIEALMGSLQARS